MSTPLTAAVPPVLGENGYILEGVMTTLDADGQTHIAPMGPLVDDALATLWLRPYRTSTTYENLKRTGVGVFHVTDDVELVAHAAVGHETLPPPATRAHSTGGVILTGACRWYAFEVQSLDDATERTSIQARVVDRGVLREFCGFNRAKHAVVEAAILATRLQFIDAATIQGEFDRLEMLVQKTGAAAEHRAFAFLRDYVARAAQAAS